MSKDFNPNYSFGEKIRLFFSFVLTRIFWPKARLIRYPHRIRGKKNISYGKGFTVGYSCRLESSGEINKIPKVRIGENVIIGDYAHIAGNFSLEIGDNVLIASRVFITDTSHGSYFKNEDFPTISPNKRKLVFKAVRIGNNVWIGENACILPGVEIGDGCVIGAAAIVTKSIPNNCIVAGNPAKIIKTYDGEWKRYENINN